jgi:RimJ/RimL family protein N-acetyltransferase
MKHTYPFLKNDTLTIRALEERDLEQFRTLRNDPDTAYFLTSVVPIAPVKQHAWFQGVSKDDSRMYFAIETTDGTFVGLVRCDEWDKINQSVRIGVDIAPQWRRKGFATQAYTLLFDFLFRQLHIHRIWLLVLSYNTPAIALYKKLGLKEEGKQREAIFRDNTYHDYIMMSILSHEYEKS